MAMVAAMETEEKIEGAFDGPRILVHGAHETRWPVTPARAAAELDARARLAMHPLAAVAMERRGDALVFPALRPMEEASDALELLSPPEAALTALTTTPRRFLRELGGPIDAVRGLGRVGLARSRVDRFLDASVVVVTPRGIDLGGVMPAALRRSGDRLTTLSLRFGRTNGWPVIDLASLALREELDTARLHVEAGGNDLAFDLALLHQSLRELSAERAEPRRESLRELVRALVTRVVPSEPARVHLRVEAPSFLDRALFAPEGDVESAHARRVLRDWDRMHVGGAVVAVVTEPRLARPPRAFPFEPLRARRARLFSRFDAGIAYDEEGLFSATPEAIAERIARGLSGVVVDATCGLGSIAIALARSAGVTRVIAIDHDAGRLRMAAHNAGLYGVFDRIDFRLGDALVLVPQLEFAALVIDPPWGGRDYDRRSMTLADLPMAIAPLLALEKPTLLKLPRSFDVGSLPRGFEIEAAIDGRGVLKMLIARRGVATPR